MTLLGIGIILFCISIFIKNNKTYFIVQLFYLWFIASFNNDNPDYFNYINGYDHILNYNGTISEPLYWIFNRFFVSLGFDYQQARCVYFGIAFCILAYGIWKMSSMPNRILGLYFLYPFATDVIQVRTLMANAFLILAIYFLSDYNETDSKKRLWFSIISILLGIGFHYACAFGVVIYLALLKNEQLKNNIIKMALLVALVVIIFAIFGGKIFNRLVDLGIIEKVGEYQSSGVNVGGYISGLIIFRILLVLLSAISLHLPLSSGNYGNATIKKDYFLFKCVLWLSLFAIAEITVSMEMERISRVPLVIAEILWTRRISISESTNARIMTVFMYFYMILYFGFVMFFHYSEGMNWLNFVFLPIFKNNIF